MTSLFPCYGNLLGLEFHTWHLAYKQETPEHVGHPGWGSSTISWTQTGDLQINTKGLIALFKDAISCWDYTATVVNECISMEHSEIILTGKDSSTGGKNMS